MIIRISAFVLVSMFLSFLWLQSSDSLEVADQPKQPSPPQPTDSRLASIEKAVRGFYSAPDAASRRSFVRRAGFVDGEIWTSFGDPLKIDEVGQLSQHDTTLTMVRVKFPSGFTSLLLEELPSGRFVVDSETANPEETRAWKTFRKNRGQDPENFRVYVTLSDYYNFGFRSETHLALQLAFPGSDDVVVGYVRRKSRDAEAILPALKGQIASPMILSLRHLKENEDPSQLVVDRWLQSDWIILDEATAPSFGQRGLASG